MGVVIKQSLRATVHVYVGIAIGFITAIVVFPRVFSPEQVGLLNILMQISLLISQFGILGVPGIITYFFVQFKDDNKGHHGFPVIVLLGTLVGCILSSLFIIASRSWMITKYPNPLFEAHYYQLILLTIASIAYINLDCYYKGFYKVVLSTFLKETLQRLLMLASVLLFLFSIVGFDFYVILYTLAVMIPSVWLFLAIASDGHFSFKTDWGYLTPQIKRGMLTVALFNILASISTYVNVGIDRIMISSMGNLEAGGIYSTTILFGTLVSIPSRTVKKITSALLAEAWSEGDMKKVSDIQHKTCQSQYIIGLFLFLGIWTNIDNIMAILPPEYAAGKWAIFWGCVTNLMEMLSGSAGPLISTSKHFRVTTYQSIMLVIIIVLANYLLIPVFGITGAAMATAISFFVFNVVRHFYITYRWNIQPYDMNTLYATLIAVATCGLIWLVPHELHFVVDICTRGTLVVLLFGGTVYFARLSADVNNVVHSILKKIPVLNSIVKLK